MRSIYIKIETKKHEKMDITAQHWRSPEKEQVVTAEVSWGRFSEDDTLTELIRTIEPNKAGYMGKG